MIQNTEDVRLDFLFWSFTWPLWLYTFVIALVGALVWVGLGVIRRHRRCVKRAAKSDGTDLVTERPTRSSGVGMAFSGAVRFSIRSRPQGGFTMLDAQARGRSRRAGRWATAAPLLALVAVLAPLAAGCGSSSDTKANEAYANSVCSAIGSWGQQMKDIATSLSGGVSQAALQTKVTQAEDATNTLVSRDQGRPAPGQLGGTSRQAATRSAHDRHQQHDRRRADGFRIDPGQRVGRRRQRGGRDARASGAKPRERDQVGDQQPEGRGRIARVGVQEHRLLPEPGR